MVPRALPWARDLLGFQPAQPRNSAAKIRLIRTSAASSLLAAQQFVNSLNSLLRRLRPTSKCGAAPQLRRKNSINSNLRCPNPRFQPSKIAKRLVRNCRAKKCCIFSLKCLDVNNLIHNFVTQVKIGCTSAKPIFGPKLQQKDGEQTASPPLREPIKTPNNEIFCPHNALHALPFSKASFRVC